MRLHRSPDRDGHVSIIPRCLVLRVGFEPTKSVKTDGLQPPSVVHLDTLAQSRSLDQQGLTANALNVQGLSD